MFDLWTLKTVQQALETNTSKAATSYTVVIDSHTTTSAVLHTMPTATTSWYPYTVLEFSPGLAVVVSSADVAAKTLAWRWPIQSNVTLGTTATLTSSPMAGAYVYIGGGAPQERTITLASENYKEGAFAIGSGYGNVKGWFLATAVVEMAFPTPTNPADYETRYYEFGYLKNQVRETLRLGVPDACRQIAFAEDSPDHYYSRGQSQGGRSSWVYRSDIHFELGMLV